MVNVLAWIVLGGILGWLAGRLVRSVGLGVVGAIFAGIIGAIVFGLIFSLLVPATFGLATANIGSWLVAAIGAVLLLFLVRALGITLRGSARI
jgi:uncharacterized membrane protein YeaQ/YmgE (transglycosylase-associated protein family)